MMEENLTRMEARMALYLANTHSEGGKLPFQTLSSGADTFKMGAGFWFDNGFAMPGKDGIIYLDQAKLEEIAGITRAEIEQQTVMQDRPGTRIEAVILFGSLHASRAEAIA